MSFKTVASALLAVVVIAPPAWVLWRQQRSAYEAAIVNRFPVLALASHETSNFVPDPLRDPSTADHPDYEAALDALVEAQYEVIRLDAALRSAAQSFRRGEIDPYVGRRAVEIASERLRSARIFLDVRIRQVRETNPAPTSKPQCPKLQSNTFVVVFDRADPNAIARLLEIHNLRVRSGIPRIPLLVVESRGSEQQADDLEATRLLAMVRSLSRSPIVRVAVESMALGESSLPVYHKEPVTQPNWFGSVHPLVNSGFPAAWNFNDAIARKGVVSVGVLDTEFEYDHEDVVLTKAAPVKDIPACTDSKGHHGLHVAGVIGATWNDFGVAGGARSAKLITCSAPTVEFDDSGVDEEGKYLCDRYATFEGLAYGLETLLRQNVKLVNASVAYNWRSSGIDPTTNDGISHKIRDLVASQGAAIRSLVRGYGDALIVTAAGNDCRVKDCKQPAKWTSPFNWAALADPNNAAVNILVVMAFDNKGERLTVSNVEGSISAIAENIPTTSHVDRSSGTPISHYGLCPPYTSCAAPMVTAAVAMMMGIDPNITVDGIRENLGIAPGKEPPLDAFQAVKKGAATQEDPDALRYLADLHPDGKIDDYDFKLFRADFVQIWDNKITEDLNGDKRKQGAPNDARFCRIDLNGDTKVTDADFDLFCKAMQADCKELKKKL